MLTRLTKFDKLGNILNMPVFKELKTFIFTGIIGKNWKIKIRKKSVD